MTSTYTYSLTSDFGGSIKEGQLHSEIAADTGITKNLSYISRNSDVVDIVFDSVLSAGEQTILNGLVSAHTPEAYVGANITNISIPNDIIDLTTYKTLVTFNFPGTKKMQNVTDIKIIGVMDEGGSSYDLRLCDVKKKNVCTSINLSNTEEAIINMGTITNLPEDEAIFELQGKINGNTIAYVKNLNFYHD